VQQCENASTGCILDVCDCNRQWPLADRESSRLGCFNAIGLECKNARVFDQQPPLLKRFVISSPCALPFQRNTQKNSDGCRCFLRALVEGNSYPYLRRFFFNVAEQFERPFATVLCPPNF